MAEKDVRSPDPRSLEEENRRLKRALEELTILNDLARAISASLSSQDIMNTIIRRSLRAVHAEQGVITLVGQQPRDPTRTLVRTMVSSSEHQPFHINECLLGWMHLNKKPLLVNEPRQDERFRGIVWDESISSVLCVPLLVKSELKGLLTIYNKRGGERFSEEDQRLLAIIAAQSAQVVENARLSEEEQALRRMQEEVRLALEIQIGLLPKASPQVPGYDIAGVSIPAQVVGGDYFDFVPIHETKLAVSLGDISGKGLPAALLMANLQATIRAQTLLRLSPKDCMQRSNSLMFQSTDSRKFATLFYGVLDAERHELCYSNAGHEWPFLFGTAKDPARLEVGGMVLSCMENSQYDEAVVPINPGDLLVIFSDGVTEAANESWEEFGEQGLAAVIRENLSETSRGLIEKIVTAVKRHAGNLPQTDDITLVVIRRERA
ncbi:MAG: PP2C family protein-serine/threonine phosphatase [Candidatus Eisenbacteria bacterium]|nr:PP2C family protein-serine/threonine phosphatase [Candidatus Eisenbacteria bacterium]